MTFSTDFDPCLWVGSTTIPIEALAEIKRKKVKADLSTYLALCRKVSESDLAEEVKSIFQEGREIAGRLDARALNELFQCPVAVWVVSTCAGLWALREPPHGNEAPKQQLLHSWIEAILHLNRVILGVALSRRLPASLNCIAENGFVHLQPCGVSIPAQGSRPRVSVNANGMVDAGRGPVSISEGYALNNRCAPTLSDQVNLRIDPYDPLLLKHWIRKTIFPHGTCADTPGDSQLATWVKNARANFAYLQSLWPGMADEITCLQSMLVPVNSPSKDWSISLSSDFFWGSILISDAEMSLFNESLIHEHSHNIMYGLLRDHSFLISGGFDGERHYSPWRPDARPLYGLLHAVYVFSRVCEYYALLIQAHPRAVKFQDRLALMHARIEIGCIVLTQSDDLTSHGRSLVTSIQAQSERLRALYSDANIENVRRILAQHLTDWQRAHRDLCPATGVLDHPLLSLAPAAVGTAQSLIHVAQLTSES